MKMKRTLLCLVSCCLLAKAYAAPDGEAAENATLKSYWAWHLNVFYPKSLPLEYGVGYNRMMKNDYYWTLNYRNVSAKSKSAPSDFKQFGFILSKPNLSDYMHTLNFRIGKRYSLFDKFKLNSEIGLSYNYYNELIIQPEVDFTHFSHDIQKVPYHLVGLSIRNSIVLRETRKTQIDAFLYHNINMKFTYTSFGLQFAFKRNKYH